MGLRDRLKRLEKTGELIGGTLTLPDGTKVRYGPEELLDAFLAALEGSEAEHRLLPYIRLMDAGEPGSIANLIWAIEAGAPSDAS